MNPYEFISYTPVEGEKHLGIAEVRLWGKIILRYKIVPTDKGFFPGVVSYKVKEDGRDIYLQAHMLDSRSEHQKVESLIRSEVSKILKEGKPIVAKEASVFSPVDEEPPF